MAEIVGPTLALPQKGLNFILNRIKLLVAILAIKFTIQYAALSRKHGLVIAFLVSTLFRNTATQYERVQRVILKGSDEDAMAFRQAVTDECNMTGIAGAIIAQVALTGLSLDNLSSAHWVARAFLLFAVSSGCLSVYHCCVLQRKIGKLYRAELVRTWLSLPHSKEHPNGATHRASLAAIVIISAPFTMTKASIFALLMGLAIYQAFVWTRALDTMASPGDSRAVFITFIVGTGAGVVFYLLTFSLKYIESTLGLGQGPLTLEDIPKGEAIRVSMRHREIQAPRRIAETQETEALPSYLETAAQMHCQCAEADRKVAVEYARLSRAGRNDSSPKGSSAQEI